MAVCAATIIYLVLPYRLSICFLPRPSPYFRFAARRTSIQAGFDRLGRPAGGLLCRVFEAAAGP